MRYRRAVEKIRILAEACRDFKRFPSEEPFLLEAYVFGDVLRGVDPLDFVEVALVLNLPPQEVIWETTPRGTEWLADYLRLSKGGFAYFWRSHLDPVSNHHIRGPVRFWSLAGPDEDVLLALSERRLDALPQVTSPPGAEGAQRAGELQAALDHRAASVTPTGIMAGAGRTVGVVAIRRTSCGKPSRVIWIFSTLANRLMTRHWRGPK